MPQTGFLFWNLNQKPLADLVAKIADTHDVEVVILAECIGRPLDFVRALNRTGRQTFYHLRSLCEKIWIFTAFSPRFVAPVFDSNRSTILRVALPARAEILLAALHFPSKRDWSGESQSFECMGLARRIGDAEQNAGHARTIVVGDFNMNPFETGMVAAAGFNAVMTMRVAERERRTVQQREYSYFYNPMWSFMGDLSDGPAGTHYYERGEHVTYYWNMYDQVLLRPSLAKSLTKEGVRILSEVGTDSLLRADGRPDQKVASDHLPLVFRLEF